MASGVELATAYVSLTVEASKIAPETAKQFGAVEKQADKSGRHASANFASGFKSSIGTAIKAGALGLAAAAAGGIAFAKGAIEEARESQKVGALTENVIRATGGAAKISAAQVGDLATALSNKTGIDDEVIQSGANMLLTFKNIRNEAGKGNDIFNQSTSVLTDMATAMGTEPKQAAIQLGKALNDPIKGVAALGRVGVTFNAQQKKTIKSLVDGGKTAEAQKVILKELNSEFGGAAEASATAGEKMSTAFGNFKEGIGTSLLPTLDKVEGFITNRLLPGVQGVIDILFKGDFTKGFAQAFNLEEDSGIVDFLFDVREGAQRFGDYVKGTVVPAVKGFFAEFKNGTGAGGKFRDVLTTTKDVLVAVVTAGVKVVGWLKDHKTTTMAAVGAVAALVAITKIHAAVMAVQAAGGILKMIQSTKIVTALTKTWTAVQWLMNAALTANPIGIVIALLVALGVGLFVAYKKSETFRNVVKGAFDAIGAAARFMWNNVVAPVIRFLLNAFDKVTGFYSTMLRALSKVPGFGWAKTAADALDKAGGKARDLAAGIRDIPANKSVTISVSTRVMTGRIKVGSESVNVGLRASGGPVVAGRPYIVGENEPELFVPRQSGTILNQRQMAAAGADGGGTTIHIGQVVAHDYNDFMRQMQQRERQSARIGRGR